jgi:hypothetical protein
MNTIMHLRVIWKADIFFASFGNVSFSRITFGVFEIFTGWSIFSPTPTPSVARHSTMTASLLQPIIHHPYAHEVSEMNLIGAAITYK